jgi:hypothetical protein
MSGVTRNYLSGSDRRQEPYSRKSLAIFGLATCGNCGGRRREHQLQDNRQPSPTPTTDARRNLQLVESQNEMEAQQDLVAAIAIPATLGVYGTEN